MNVVLDFISYSTAGFGFICIAYLLGHFVRVKKTSKILPNEILSFLIGIFIIVSLWAIFMVHGKTMFLLPIPFFLVYLIKNRKELFKTRFDFKELIKFITVNGIPFIVIAIMVFYRAIHSDVYPFLTISRDDIFFGMVNDQIVNYGVECFRIDWGEDMWKLGATPYHFFEIYLSTIFSKLFGIIGVRSFWLISMPIVIFSAYLTFVGLIKSIYEKVNEIILIAVTLSIIFFMQTDILYNSSVLIGSPKLLTLITALIVVIMAFIRKEKEAMFLTILVLPQLNYFFLPLSAVWILIVAFIYHKWHEKISRKEMIIYSLIYLGFFGSYLILGKILQGDILVTGLALGLEDIIDYFDSIQKVKTLIAYGIEYIMDPFVRFGMFSVIIAISIFFTWKKIDNGVKLAILMSFGLLGLAFCMSLVLYFIDQSYQPVVYVMQMLLIIFAVFFLFFKNFGTYPRMRNGLFALIVIMSIVSNYNYVNGNRMNRYSSEYLQEIKSVEKFTNGKGGRLVTPDYYTNTYMIPGMCHFEGYYLAFLRNDVELHTLSIDNIPKKESLHDYYNYNRERTMYNSFFAYYRQARVELTENDVVDQFIEDRQLTFVIAIAGVILPEAVKKRIERIIIDSKSGEKFILLKQQI